VILFPDRPLITSFGRIRNRPDIGACLPQPLFDLLQGYFARIIRDPVHLVDPLPSFGNRYDSRPSFQGGCADIVSVHGKDGVCRISGRRPRPTRCRQEKTGQDQDRNKQ